MTCGQEELDCKFWFTETADMKTVMIAEKMLQI